MDGYIIAVKRNGNQISRKMYIAHFPKTPSFIRNQKPELKPFESSERSKRALTKQRKEFKTTGKTNKN